MALPPTDLPATDLRLLARRLTHDDRVTAVEEAVAAEVPVALVYNGISYAVMMASPADLEDFALGFSLTEGLADTPADLTVQEVVADDERGIEVRMALRGEHFAQMLQKVRNITGRTGCGICGTSDLDTLHGRKRQNPKPITVERAAIRKALADLDRFQDVRSRTGAVHAAAWVDARGRIQLVREDVGRHNALDKLVGALARAGIDGGQGFCLITSRCSFEMVQKTAAAGIPLLVAISAPTTLAIDTARAAGVTLVAFARGDGMTAYTDFSTLLPAKVEAA
jgi:FdhD protein